MSTTLDSLDGPGLWTCLRDAALGIRRADSDAASEMMTAEGHVRLGWVVPPAWDAVAKVTSEIVDSLPLATSERLIVVGTGGWGFAVHALWSVLDEPGPGHRALLPLDSLDPGVTCSVLEQAGDPRSAACLAISGSHETIETRILAKTIVDVWRRPRLVWLGNDRQPGYAFRLSLRGLSDQIAQFGAPLSTAFLAPAAFADFIKLERAYRVFSTIYQDIGCKAAGVAASAPVRGAPRLMLLVPRDVCDAAQLWMVQLVRQALCGKSRSFEPWVDVGHGEAESADFTARLDFLTESDPLLRLMGMFYAVGVFTACLALRAGLNPATHDHVREYKSLIQVQPHRNYPLQALRIHDSETLVHVACDWLSGRTGISFLQIVVYDHAATRAMRNLRQVIAARTGLSCEIHEGPEWNHHSYQAAYGNTCVAVIVVVVRWQGDDRGCALSRALAANADMRYAIALATHQSLNPGSHIVELVRPG